MVLKRFVKGLTQEPFFQKRVPEGHPFYIDTATLHYASGTSAEEAVLRNAAGLAWVSNLGCLDLNPHAVRAEDLDHPDELRVDSRPDAGRRLVADRGCGLRRAEVLEDHGLVGWPKTSGSRGLHILVRITPDWGFADVRLAAETLAREVENRAPGLATARWWKEERGESVFVDFNQNAKDRTVASAYSIRPLPDARVSTPLDWDEVRSRRPEEFTVLTVPQRFAQVGDPHAGIDDAAGSLDALLALAKRLGPPRRRRGPATARDAGSRRCRSSRWRARRPSPRRWRRWRSGRPHIRRSRGCCTRPTSCWTACAGRARSGTGCGSTSSTSRSPTGPSRARSWPTTTRGPGGSGRDGPDAGTRHDRSFRPALPDIP
ncbi:hypothetical protein GCM10023068_44140 [Leifsonia shinshuensis]